MGLIVAENIGKNYQGGEIDERVGMRIRISERIFSLLKPAYSKGSEIRTRNQSIRRRPK